VVAPNAACGSPDGPRGRRARGQPRAGADALGTGAYWWNKPLKELRLATFNARIERVTTKPSFREPFKHRRCLIPVSGYYEWQDTPNGKQPWYFTAQDGSPLLNSRWSVGSVEKQANGRANASSHAR